MKDTLSRVAASLVAFLRRICFFTIPLMFILISGAQGQDLRLQESGLVARLFSSWDDSSEQRTLFNLWLTDLLIPTDSDTGAMISAIEATSAGAIPTLRALVNSDNLQIASLSDLLLNRIYSLVGDPVVDSDVVLVENLTPNSTIQGGWISTSISANSQLAIDFSSCPSLLAALLNAETLQGLDGGVYRNGIAILDVRDNQSVFLFTETAGCTGDTEVSIRSKPISIASGNTPDSPQEIFSQNKYRLNLDSEQSEWLNFSDSDSGLYVLETFSTEDDLDPYITLYDDDQRQLESNDDGGFGLNSKLEFFANPGTNYLIEVSELIGFAGSLELELSRKLTPEESAVEVIYDQPFDRELDSSNDEYWWNFSTPSAQLVSLAITPIDAVDTIIELFEDNGISQIGYDDDGGEGSGSQLQLTTTPNEIYYVRVAGDSGSTGRFSFSATTEDPPETLANAVTLPYTGNYDLPENSGELWFKFEAEEGQYYGITTHPADYLDTVLELFESNGVQQIAYGDDAHGGLGSAIYHIAEQSGELVFKVSAYGLGGGNFELSISTLDPRVQANELAVDPPIRLTEVLEESQFYSKWWVVETSATTKYVFQALPTINSNTDTEMFIYDFGSLEELAYDDDGAVELGSMIELTGTGRQILIQVRELHEQRGNFEFVASTSEM